jgi:hypothetical protein
MYVYSIIIIQAISIIFIDETSTYLFSKSTFYADTKLFICLSPSVTILENDKANFKTAFPKIPTIHTPFIL